MSFSENLQRGKLREMQVRQLFDEAGIFTVASVGRNPAYDLLIRATLELKSDDAAIRTQHLFVETASHGQPSGINLSQATTQGFIVGNRLFLFSTERLKVILPELEKRIVPDGQKEGRILPIHSLSSIPHQRFLLGGLK